MRLIWYLVECVEDEGAFDVSTRFPSFCDLELLTASIVGTLAKIGAAIPEAFPAELALSLGKLNPFLDTSRELHEELHALVSVNPYAKAVRDILRALDALWGYYAAGIRTLRSLDEDEVLGAQMSIEACMIDLAATRIVVDEAFAPNMPAFRQKVLTDYKAWLAQIRNKVGGYYGCSYRIDLMMEMIGLDGQSS